MKDGRLEEAVKLHGNDWVKVAAYVGNGINKVTRKRRVWWTSMVV